MNLRLILILMLAISWLMPANGDAAEHAKGKKKADNTAKTEAKDKAEAGSATADNPEQKGGLNFSMGNDLPFKKITFDQFHRNADGDMTFIGQAHRVIVESDQMNLECNALHYNEKTKIMTADGTPVKMSQGDTIKGECQHLVYTAEKKTYVLSGGRPFISQKTKDNTATMNGDIITVTQDKEGGKPSVDITSLPNSNYQPYITNTPNSSKPKGPNKANQANQRIDKDHIDAIREPAIESTP